MTKRPANITAEEMAKDIRLDRIVTWILMVMISAGISVAAYTYKRMSDQIDKLNSTLGSLDKTVAVMQAQIGTVTDHEKRIRDLELWQSRTEGK